MKPMAVLGNSWSGLGDHLQFSTLPEILTLSGHDVFVNEDCIYRNQEIKDLVWGTNPFVKGFIDKPSNVGSVVSVQNTTTSVVSNWELAHFGQVFNKYPKIYYRPKTVTSLSNKVVLDLSAISDTYEDDKLMPAIDKKLKGRSDVVQIAFANDIGTDLYAEGRYPTHVVSSIFEYIDCLASCPEFVCLMSGGAVAAAALEHMGLTPYTTVFMSVPKNIFKFDNINYVEL